MVGAISRVTKQAMVEPVKALTKEEVYPVLGHHIPKGSTVYTDTQATYMSLSGELKLIHEQVSHKGEWVRGEVHTNTIENFWSF